MFQQNIRNLSVYSGMKRVQKIKRLNETYCKRQKSVYWPLKEPCSNGSLLERLQFSENSRVRIYFF